MTAEYAADIVTWRYPPPYDCYDMTGADRDFILDPRNGFFALVADGAGPRSGQGSSSGGDGSRPPRSG